GGAGEVRASRRVQQDQGSVDHLSAGCGDAVWLKEKESCVFSAENRVRRRVRTWERDCPTAIRARIAQAVLRQPRSLSRQLSVPARRKPGRIRKAVGLLVGNAPARKPRTAFSRPVKNVRLAPRCLRPPIRLNPRPVAVST